MRTKFSYIKSTLPNNEIYNLATTKRSIYIKLYICKQTLCIEGSRGIARIIFLWVQNLIIDKWRAGT